LVSSITLVSDAGHYPLPPRLVSRFRFCVVEYPTVQDLIKIYSSHVALAFKDSNQPTHRVDEVSNIMVRIFNEIRNTFIQTDKPHYVFTLNHLTNWVFGLMRYDITGNCCPSLAICFSTKSSAHSTLQCCASISLQAQQFFTPEFSKTLMQSIQLSLRETEIIHCQTGQC
uniref:AAA_lid_1 domain-containing protein n=1 Tax=Gongylonema pulchrum TaxID=637853 RepID=A0A183CW68_9BILA